MQTRPFDQAEQALQLTDPDRSEVKAAESEVLRIDLFRSVTERGATRGILQTPRAMTRHFSKTLKTIARFTPAGSANSKARCIPCASPITALYGLPNGRP
jgi:hypothetical protein